MLSITMHIISYLQKIFDLKMLVNLYATKPKKKLKDLSKKMSKIG